MRCCPLASRGEGIKRENFCVFDIIFNKCLFFCAEKFWKIISGANFGNILPSAFGCLAVFSHGHSHRILVKPFF